MAIIIEIIKILAFISGCLIACMSILLFLRLSWPAPAMLFLKLYVSALSALLVFIAVLISIVGLTTGSIFISLIGIYDVLIFSMHLFRVTRQPGYQGGFEQAFGLHWESRISTGQKKYFLSKSTVLKLPAVPHPRIKQNISFANIPGTNRKLLCDVWQPPENMRASRLAFIYFHGSAWYLMDKDAGTRKFFSHLAAQGHVIMDVAYRLAPETDMMGMVNDVKRAIAWIKENAGTYGVDPNRVIVGGASAGAQLALLAAYTANDPGFTPKELEGKDLNVCAVISEYGPTDLTACYFHTNQHLTTRSLPGKPKKTAPTQMPGWIIKKMGKEYYRFGMNKGFGNAGALAPLLGGHPDECPETYALFSPVTHVHADCPPTLLIQGEHDLITQAKATRFMFTRLVEKKIKTVMHILPQTDHAFDLILPKISPSAHAAFYDVERFMALMVLENK